VSLGGGAVLRDKNVKFMKRRGIVVFIDTPFEVIFERVKRNDRRPLASKLDYEGLYELYEKRRDIYLSAADVILCPKDNICDTYEEFIRVLKERDAIEE
jgi:shikimate kinase